MRKHTNHILIFAKTEKLILMTSLKTNNNKKTALTIKSKIKEALELTQLIYTSHSLEMLDNKTLS